MVSKQCNLYSLDGTKHPAGLSDLAIELASRPNVPHSPLVSQNVKVRAARGPVQYKRRYTGFSRH